MVQKHLVMQDGISSSVRVSRNFWDWIQDQFYFVLDKWLEDEF